MTFQYSLQLRVDSTITPSDGRRFLWCCSLHSLLFFIWCCSSVITVFKFLGYFFCATGTPPWLLRPVKASTTSELYPGSFQLLLLFPSTTSATVLSGHFLPSGVFYLTLLPHIFYTTCYYRGLPGSRQFFLEICRASCWSLKHRPGPSFCLIYSNPQPWYSKEFVFKLYQILSWITCGKKLSLSTPYSFQTVFAGSKYM